jgi:ABC-type branched-subunit amino acid transport system substrate-binding protein
VVALVVALVATGCAAFGKTKAASVACNTPGLTSKQLTLGAIFPNTSSAASVLTGYRAGIDARLGVANAAGGINGRQIVYTWADDQGLPARNLFAAQQVVRQGALGIVELSSASGGGAQWLNQQGVPVVGAAIDPAWSQYRNMFSYAYLVARGPSVSTLGAYVKAQGGTKAALLYSAFRDVSTALTRQWESTLRAAGVAVDKIEATSGVTDPATVAAEIKAHGDDALTGDVDTALLAQIAIATNQASPGQLKVILSEAGYDKAFLDAFGHSLPGLSTYIAYAPFEQRLAAANKFLNAMTEYSPEVQPSRNEIALAGWIDTDLTLTGLAAAGPCPTRASLMTALRNITHYDAGGVLAGPIDLKTNFGQLNLCLTFLKIAPSGTSWTVVPPAPSCGHLIP